MQFGLVILILSAGVFLLTVLFGAPFVPTKSADVSNLIASLNQKTGVFVDLGCGGGGVLLAAAQAGYMVVGYEINPFLWLIANIRLKKYDAKIYLRNYQRANLTKASVIYVFTASPYTARLSHKLAREVPRGAAVISYGFKLALTAAPKQQHGYYVYQF